MNLHHLHKHPLHSYCLLIGATELFPISLSELFLLLIAGARCESHGDRRATGESRTRKLRQTVGSGLPNVKWSLQHLASVMQLRYFSSAKSSSQRTYHHKKPSPTGSLGRSAYGDFVWRAGPKSAKIPKCNCSGVELFTFCRHVRSWYVLCLICWARQLMLFHFYGQHRWMFLINWLMVSFHGFSMCMLCTW